jgi:hypothetical protein
MNERYESHNVDLSDVDHSKEQETATTLRFDQETKNVIAVPVPDEVIIADEVEQRIQQERIHHFLKRQAQFSKVTLERMDKQPHSYGPQYEIVDESRNTKFSVITLKFNPPDSNECQYHLAYAGDDLVAYQTNRLEFHDGKPRYVVGIYSSPAGPRGVASSLEILRGKMMQDKANELNQVVTDYYPENANLSRLKLVEQDYQRNPNEYNLAKLYYQAKEQVNWQGLFGQSGIAGLGKEKKREYKPNPSASDSVQDYRTVRYSRVSGQRDFTLVDA